MNARISKFAVAIALFMAASPAFAQNVGVTAGASASVSAGTGLMTRMKARATEEIERRIAALNELSARIGEMRKLSSSNKAALRADVAAQIGLMNDLKSEVAADTDLDMLRADVRSITGSYRIYALVIPKGHIMAAADRELYIAELMASYRVKLTAAIDAAKAAGRDAALMEASLSDFDAKIASAKVQANAAVSAVANLSPDNGDQAAFDANKEALKNGRSKVKAASADLKAAWEDAKTIVAKAKSWKLKVSATTTASTTAR